MGAGAEADGEGAAPIKCPGVERTAGAGVGNSIHTDRKDRRSPLWGKAVSATADILCFSRTAIDVQ